MVYRKFHKYSLFDDNRAEDVGSFGELVSVRMKRVDIILYRCIESATEELNLRPSTMLCLALIINQPGLSQNELTLQTPNDKSTIVGVVDELEQLGWARRELSQSDRRSRSLFSTEKGRDIFDKITRAVKKKEEKLLAEIPQKDIDFLWELLDRMHDSCVKSLDILDVPINVK